MDTNEKFIRQAYEIAEKVDIPAWNALFTEDGTLTDYSVEVTYRGRDEVGQVVDIMHRAFSDMHRELQRVYVSGNTVIVQLRLQGTHDGPFDMPSGSIPATGRKMDAPCCDVFELEDGKVKRFDCYPEGSVVLAQLGVLSIG